MPSPDAHGGSLVAGRFRLGELLGSGGSASVFAAVDTRTGTPLALKILHPHLSERPVAREAFLDEARRVEPLRHPNVVGVLDVGFEETEAGPLAWIALERAEGRSLSELVANDGALAPTDAVAVIDGVLRALEAAHRIGLVHRDVSPANIMVSRPAAGSIDVAGVRLLDFGLADAAGSSTLGTDDLLSVTATGRAGVIGNVNYMSPEQARGEPVDARGDVYQAGAVLHFALTGRPPFPRDSAEQTMHAHLYTPPPVPSVLNPRSPRGLDRVVVRAMLKDPADRFPSAAAMRSAVVALGLGAVAAGPLVTTVFDAAEARPGVPVPVAVPGAVEDRTRILGRTAVPARAVVAAAPAVAPLDAPVQRAPQNRTRTGAWFAAAVAAAVVTAVVLVAAANTTPTSSVEAGPTPSPSESQTPGATNGPQPSPTPTAGADAAQTPVPPLSGLTLGEAEAALAAAGLTMGAVTAADSPYPRDRVLQSSPPSGGTVRPGSAVALTVASGFNAVPDVAGQGRDAAVSLVQAAGFAPSFASRVAPAGTPEGSILGTDPGPGATVAVGTPITVLEAVAPAQQAPTPTPTPTLPAPTPTPTPTPTPSAGER